MTGNRKKVLFLIESLAGGGAEKVLSVLVAHLDKTKFDVTVLSVVNTGIHIDSIQKHAHYQFFLDNPASDRSFWSRLVYRVKYNLIQKLPGRLAYRWLIKDAFEFEVAFIEGLATKIISASINPRSRKLAWVHTDLQANHWTKLVFHTLQREAQSYRRFDQIVCVSRQVKDSLASLLGIVERTSVLHNPVDTREILQKAEEGLPVAEDRSTLRLVSTGRLVEQKGYDRLLNIHKRLLDDGLAHELWILGEGPQRPQLEAYLQQHQLEGSVRLWGFLANPYAIMRQCDLFVCSSLAEGFSTAVTEALILGIPVITTDCSGMRELLGDQEGFGIITGNSEDALYDGLKSLLTEPERLAHYRRQAILRGQEFGLKQTLPAVEALLEGVI
ncbi:MAG: glycosyltransferase [Holophagaceae bacterium]|nr:glycosyltransferase [Holophagaceae bacterium]